MNQTFAEKIPQQKRRKIQAWSIVANCLGSLSEVMLDNSAILISYVALLGGNESLNMLMAGATGFIALLLQIASTTIDANRFEFYSVGSTDDAWCVEHCTIAAHL